MAKHRNRASDAQRATVQQALDTAFAAGRLDHFEHFERMRTATKAKYVDELRPLVEDLRESDDDLGLGSADSDPAAGKRRGARQPGGAATGARGKTRSARMGMIIGMVVAFVVAGGVAVIAATTSDSSSEGMSTEDLTPGLLHTEDGVNRLIADTQADPQFASRGIDSILIYGKYATLSQQDPATPHKRVTYEYRGGWEERRIDPIDAKDTLDVSTIMPSTVIAALNATSDVLDLDSETMVISHVQISADALGDPEVRVSASKGKYGDLGTATFGADGRLRQVQEP